MHLAVAAAVLGWTVVTAPARTDRDRDELVGPVKSVAVRWQANHVDQYGQIDERDLGIRTYDEKGNLLLDRSNMTDFVKERRPERRSPGETMFHSVMGDSFERYQFDAAGNMVKREEWYDSKPDGPAVIVERMRYDATGRLINRIFDDDDGKVFDERIYERDAAGHVVTEEDRPRDRQPPYPRMHYTYTFDSRGNWTSRIVRRENVGDDAVQYRYAGNLFRRIEYFQ